MFQIAIFLLKFTFAVALTVSKLYNCIAMSKIADSILYYDEVFL